MNKTENKIKKNIGWWLLVLGIILSLICLSVSFHIWYDVLDSTSKITPKISNEEGLKTVQSVYNVVLYPTLILFIGFLIMSLIGSVLLINSTKKDD